VSRIDIQKILFREAHRALYGATECEAMKYGYENDCPNRGVVHNYLKTRGSLVETAIFEARQHFKRKALEMHSMGLHDFGRWIDSWCEELMDHDRAVKEIERQNPILRGPSPTLSPVSIQEIARLKGYTGEACAECASFTITKDRKCDTCGATQRGRDHCDPKGA
jgi:hypothetical protein